MADFDFQEQMRQHSTHLAEARERYWDAFCIGCGSSPCRWDGIADGFHTATEQPAPTPAHAGHHMRHHTGHRS